MRPATSIAPARPAKPPDKSATHKVVFEIETPAKALARELAPTARISKPKTVKFISTHKPTARKNAPIKPLWTRVCGINLVNSNSLLSATLCGQPIAEGSFIGPSSIMETNKSAMKLSSNVVTTSSTPRCDLSSAGPSNISAPAKAAATIMKINNKPGAIAKPEPPWRPPTATAAKAPAYNWPSAPILNKRALNATAAASPVSISGMARVSVSLSATTEPKAPWSSKT